MAEISKDIVQKEVKYMNARAEMSKLLTKIVNTEYRDMNLIDDCYTLATWYLIKGVFPKNVIEEYYEIINSMKRNYERRSKCQLTLSH